ncbi:MAG: PQQ-binding-like beta-propeller repeat protein [Phycisphaerae bacterium]
MFGLCHELGRIASKAAILGIAGLPALPAIAALSLAIHVALAQDAAAPDAPAAPAAAPAPAMGRPATAPEGGAKAKGGNGDALLGSADFQPSPEHPFGWRGDGNGRFPAAKPPLTWGRESAVVKGLSAQAKKPKPSDKGQPVQEGVIRGWLTLGPVPIPAGKTAKDDFETGEDKWEPDEGTEAGDLKWSPVAPDGSWLHFWPMYNKAAPDAKGVVAYAHAWIHSAQAKPVFIDVMASDTTRIWLNGKPAGSINSNGLDAAGHFKLDLPQGWNRLLLRVAPHLDTGWAKGVIQWHFTAALYGADPNEYESKNILWSLRMPDNGPGVGSPVLAGDKLFLEADAGVLLCVSASDGKPLWARSSTYADAASAQERKQNAAVFTQIEPMAAKIKAALDAYCADPGKYPDDVKAKNERVQLEKKINAFMRTMDSEKYCGQSDSEAGESAPTPVTDGQNVYAVFGSGVVACFDLNGNRKWTTALDLKYKEHGYCASPCLIDGYLVLVAKKYAGAVALDARTGEVATPIALWKSTPKDEADPYRHAMYGTALAVTVGGQKLVAFAGSVMARPSDGKVVTKGFKIPDYQSFLSATVEGRALCSSGGAPSEGAMDFVFHTLPEAFTEPLNMQEAKQAQYNVKAFPTWFAYNHCASPLLYQGLAYVVSVDGVLTVIDAAKGEVVYQKLLDLSPFMNHSGVKRCGCSSSPALGGKHIYIWGDQGAAVVIEPGRAFRQIAKNRIEQGVHSGGASARNECSISCPVFSGSRIYYRGELNLYCIGEKPR